MVVVFWMVSVQWCVSDRGVLDTGGGGVFGYWWWSKTVLPRIWPCFCEVYDFDRAHAKVRGQTLCKQCACSNSARVWVNLGHSYQICGSNPQHSQFHILFGKPLIDVWVVNNDKISAF